MSNNSSAYNGGIEVIKFDKHNIPKPNLSVLPKDKEKRVDYGSNNLYPDWLMYLYTNSPIHSAIINSKVTYIVGEGLKDTQGNEVTLVPNEDTRFSKFTSQCITDFLLFNAFAVEVVYNAFGDAKEYYWIPVNKIRTNQNKDKFWYSEDWKTDRNGKEFPAFGDTTSENTIFYFDGYLPSLSRVYPTPEYSGCLSSITTDIAIRDFNLNNIKNQFSVSTLITFFNGSNVPDATKQKILREIKECYTGENGRKFIVDFQNSKGSSADVKNISPNDWDKAYAQVAESVSNDIYRGHQVTSPMLMGVKTAGQLGGASELETAYEIFKNTYISGKRSELEQAFKDLFGIDVEFTDKPLFSTKISDSLKEKIYTVNELRAEVGLPAKAGEDRLLSEDKVPVKAKWEYKHLTSEDYDKVAHLGEDGSNFERVPDTFSKDTDIAQFIIENKVKNTTVSVLQDRLKDIGISVGKNELKGLLQDLTDSGIINAKISGDKVRFVQPKTDLTPPATGTIEVLYDYQKRPDVSGPTIIPTSRDFCRRMVENDKLYSREDIQKMSALFGYNVFKMCGGYYRNPDTGETVPHCRHRWVATKVKRKIAK